MVVEFRFDPGVVLPGNLKGEHYWVAIHDGRVLLLADDFPVPFPLLRSFGLTGLDAEDRHYLGQLDGHAVFAVRPAEASLQELPGLAWVDLRRLLVYGNPLLFSLAGRARQVLDWARDHRWCSRCGKQATFHERDRAMVCTACGYTQYPRVSPCVIALVTRGDQALLARSARFPPGMYSTLAGFVEAGESVEEALAREVREEAGISIADMNYVGSQSWPFPHSLMLGFTARHAQGEIVVDGVELEDARWFGRDALPAIPPKGSISRLLIDRWLEV